MIKIKKTHSTKNRLSSELDLFDGAKVPLRDKKRVAREVGELLIDSILLKVGKARSPLAKGKWDKLSPGYKKFKQSKNLGGKANLEFKGNLLDSLKAKVLSDGTLELGHFSKSQAGKADGHNNFSGKSELPLRRYIPDKGDKFRKGIAKDAQDIINEVLVTSKKIPKSRLSGIKNSGELFSFFDEILPGATKAEITRAVLADDTLMDELRALGLLGFL